MNILDVIDERYLHRYHGKNDILARYIVSKLIDKKDNIINHFNNQYNTSVINKDKFIDYVWIETILPIKEIEEMINQENKKAFHDLVECIRNVNFDYKNINKYIKNNYLDIFSKNQDEDTKYNYELRLAAFQKIYTHYSFFSEKAFRYIEQNYAYLIVGNIVICEKYYSSKTEDFIKIFDFQENKYLLEIYNFESTFSDLNKTSKKFVKDFLVKTTENAVKEAIKLAEEITEDNYLEYYVKIEGVLQIVKNNKFSFIDLYKLDALEEKVKVASKGYIEKHGSSFSVGPINLEEVFLLFKEGIGTDKEFVNYLNLTHTYNTKEDRIIANIIPLYREKESIVDRISSSTETDDYFSHSRLSGLQIYLKVHSPILYLLFNDEYTSSFMYKMMLTQLHEIDTNEAQERLELTEAFKGIYPMLKKVITGTKEIYTSQYKVEAVSTSMFIVSLIEKILRRLVINLSKNDIYYSDNDLNLGDLLRTRNSNGSDYHNVLTTIYDVELIKTLEYLLVKTQNSNIGSNIRNNLMHNRNYKLSDMNNGFPVQIYLIFLFVVNGIYAYYLNTNRENDKKNSQ